MEEGAEMRELDADGRERLVAVLEVTSIDARGRDVLGWKPVAP